MDNLLLLNSVNNIFLLFTRSSLVSGRLWLAKGMLFWTSGCKVHSQTSWDGRNIQCRYYCCAHGHCVNINIGILS